MAVEIQVVANTKQAEKSMEKLEKKVDKVGASASNTAGGFDKVTKSVKDVANNDKLGNLEKNTERAAKSAENLESNFANATKTINRLVIVSTALITTYITVKGVVAGVADEYRRINSQLRLVTRSTNEIVRANSQLFKIAQDTRSSFEATTNLFTRFARVSNDLGATQQDVLQVTKTVQQAIKVSGTSAQSAEAAIIQLGQGLASGTLRGEELNSVLEQAPRLAQAIADGIGVSVGELRKLGAEGKITSAEVFEALLGQSTAIAAEFKKVETTFAGASQKAGNAFARFVNELDRASGFSKALIGSTESIGEAFERASGKVAVFAIQVRLTMLKTRLAVKELFTDILNTVKNSDLGKDVAEAFESLKEIDLSSFALPTIELDTVVSGFDEAISVVDSFYTKMKEYFNKLFTDILGGGPGSYSGLVDGIQNKTQDLITNTLPFLRKFQSEVAYLGQTNQTRATTTTAPAPFMGSSTPATTTVAPAPSLGTNNPFAMITASSPLPVFIPDMSVIINTLGIEMPASLKIIGTALSGISFALEGVSKFFRLIQDGLGTVNFGALIAAVITLNGTLRKAVTQGGISSAGRGFADVQFEAPRLDQTITKLTGELAALERVAGVSSGRVKGVNESLTLLAERSTPQVAKQIQSFEKTLRKAGNITAQEAQELEIAFDRLSAGLTESSRIALRREIDLRKGELNIDDVRKRATATATRLAAAEQRRTDITENSKNAIMKFTNSIRNFSSSVGGIAGAAAGFTIAQEFVDVLNKQVGDLPGWAEAGVTFAGSVIGQGIGTAIGQVAGAAFIFFASPFALKAAAVFSAVSSAIGVKMAAAFRIALLGAAALKAIGLGIAGAIGLAIGSVPLAIAGLAIGGLTLAVYFKDSIIEAFKTAKDKIVDVFSDIFSEAMRFARSLLPSFLGGGEEPRKMATGGAVSGKGSGTSDSIPAMLSNGEYVINAKATKDNRALLEAINNGANLPGFKTGGQVGTVTRASSLGFDTKGITKIDKAMVSNLEQSLDSLKEINGLLKIQTSEGLPADPATLVLQQDTRDLINRMLDEARPVSAADKKDPGVTDPLGAIGLQTDFKDRDDRGAIGMGADAAGINTEGVTKKFESMYEHIDKAASRSGVTQQENFEAVGGGLMTLLGENAKYSESSFKATQALSIAQAIMNTATGATKALAQGGVAGPALAAMVVASGAAQISAIKSQKFQAPKGYANGGYVSGPGTGRSDSISAALSNGEFVMNQKATAANRQTLEAMNSGQSVQQGGGYIANQTVQVEVGLGRNSQATADAAGASVINAINQGNADGRMSRRRAR